MIRLHLIEDHPIIYDGFRQRFRHTEDGIMVTGHSGSVNSFINEISPAAFDVIILDLWLQGEDPLENIKKIKFAFPDKPVVIFTFDESLYWINQMMTYGANAYISKKATKMELKEIIGLAYAGKIIYPTIAQDGNNPDIQKQLFQLNLVLKPTEQHILTRLVNGCSAKEIATEMKLTVSAIEKTLKRLRKSFRVKTNIELIRLLIERKLI